MKHLEIDAKKEKIIICDKKATQQKNNHSEISRIAFVTEIKLTNQVIQAKIF